jgi:hypothetical protein
MVDRMGGKGNADPVLRCITNFELSAFGRKAPVPTPHHRGGLLLHARRPRNPSQTAPSRLV